MGFLVGSGLSGPSGSSLAAQEPEITIADILDGIRSRRTRYQSVHVIYDHQRIASEFFADRAILRQRVKTVAQPEAVVEQTVTVEAATGKDADEATKKAERIAKKAEQAASESLDETINRYDLLEAGDQRAFKTYHVNLMGEATLIQEGVFDGQILRVLRANQPLGLVQRATPEEALRFPTVAQITGLNGQDIEGYLQQFAEDMKVLGVRTEGQEVLVDVEHRRALPVVGGGLALANVTRLTFDATKDFWLTEAQIDVEYRRAESEPKIFPVLRKKIKEYQFVDGFYYPKEVEATEYDVLPAAPPEADLGAISRNLTPGDAKPIQREFMRVVEVAINQEIPATAFELPFPAGTKYVDEIQDGQFIVGVDGVVRSLGEVLNMPVLPVNKYSEDEAAAILAKFKQKQEGSKGQWWLAGITLATVCLAAGAWIARRFGHQS